ncbi:hypothetical protein CBP31_15060 [Oceanisphaera profunda]|uniref:Uncharacterized protein n=1 Tax=Oceanisphaera profunda TaxID=1416627 RepID=A0A1Y0D884_9GAMM|nr:hypothetical protein [Oceanisphaera profunda]ART83791.1 hypothetical protein CBP31_15060 [Oceanisphaera profunda]
MAVHYSGNNVKRHATSGQQINSPVSPQERAFSFYEQVICSEASDDIKKEALKSYSALVLKVTDSDIEIYKSNNNRDLEHQKESNKNNVERQKEANKYYLEGKKEDNSYMFKYNEFLSNQKITKNSK